MTSVLPHFKTIPSEGSYYINVASLSNQVFKYENNAFAVASWATDGPNCQTRIANAGQAVLRDLGKTVVSSMRTFRKVQLINSSIKNGTSIGAPVSSQNGANVASVAGEEYFTGYIELPGAVGTRDVAGTSGTGAITFAPVARLG